MRKHLWFAVLALIALAASPAGARKTADTLPARTTLSSDFPSKDRFTEPGGPASLASSAVATTLVLASYKFDAGATCTAQGWTHIDLTAQTAAYWHVDDFAEFNALGSIPPGTVSQEGIAFTPIAGLKSMWAGKRIPPGGPIDPIHCAYLSLPGYGNAWNQSFCSKDCMLVSGGPTANLDVAFKIKFDSEASYDALVLEYTNDCEGNAGWTEIDGGVGTWDGAGSLTIANSYAVGAGPIKVRFRFQSDQSWSNEDGLYDGFGAALDDLTWEGKPVEDFEGELVGDNTSDDWQICNTPGFGNYLALVKRDQANYEDPCVDNLSCYWAAIQGSTEFYTCGNPPQPAQRVVPHINQRGEYLNNEIWSPWIPLGGSGSDFRLRYAAYEDLPLSNLIFHKWHVRTIGASGCPGPWRDRNFLFQSDTKSWVFHDFEIGAMVDANTGTAIQVALGVVDMCPFWCGVFGTGACHSPAPYFDSVRVLRIDRSGPQWDVRAIDTFQDTFSANGTITGTARIDNALDIKPSASNTMLPGDSAIAAYVKDGNYATTTNQSGLSDDPVLSTFVGRHKTKRQVYLYATVIPDGQPGKSGAPLSEGPGGQANRYPFMGTEVIGGATWTKIRMDYTYTGTATQPGEGSSVPLDPIQSARFNVDLNDNLFTPGDTILYFFSATSPGGTTYYSTEYGPTDDLSAVAANPMEVTILPAGGYNRGGEVLYVDGADGFGVQPYFDGALMSLGLNDVTDRYDVRGPSSGTSNRLAGRVTNVAAQLNACYQAILWDTGSLSITLGDGSGDPEKTDDYGLLNTFLANLDSPGGVFLSGDRVAEYLAQYIGAGALTFRSTYMPFTLINRDHRLAPSLFPISPQIKFWPGRAFSDNFFLAGGCPTLNDFDVIGAAGSSLVQMSYNTASDPNGAVVASKNGNAGVMMSGFSFSYVRDDELDGLSDRAVYLFRVLQYLYGYLCAACTDAGPPGPQDGLSQNYPNPFNPTTTIAFSLKARGHVEITVYDVAGRLVREIANEVRAQGSHKVSWDGRNGAGESVASGVYFYRLTAPGFSQTKKMVLLK